MTTVEYTYTLTTGWQALSPDQTRLPQTAPSAGDALHALGYVWIAESAASDCGVGHFFLWQREVPDPAWPRYVADCQQWGDETIVWLEDLPTLWDWVRLYGPVAVLLQRHYGDDDEDDEDDEGCDGPQCPDCGMPMSRVPVVPLHVVRAAPADFDA